MHSLERNNKKAPFGAVDFLSILWIYSAFSSMTPFQNILISFFILYLFCFVYGINIHNLCMLCKS